jgi:hypothetical protein
MNSKRILSHAIPTQFLFFHDLPILKTAAESYTRNSILILKKNFKKSLTLSCRLLSQDGTMSTYKFMLTNCEGEAYAVFNSDDVTVSCSCKMYERTGMLFCWTCNCLHLNLLSSCYNSGLFRPSRYAMQACVTSL